jgi:hypothetical protein
MAVRMLNLVLVVVVAAGAVGAYGANRVQPSGAGASLTAERPRPDLRRHRVALLQASQRLAAASSLLRSARMVARRERAEAALALAQSLDEQRLAGAQLAADGRKLVLAGQALAATQAALEPASARAASDAAAVTNSQDAVQAAQQKQADDMASAQRPARARRRPEGRRRCPGDGAGSGAGRGDRLLTGRGSAGVHQRQGRNGLCPGECRGGTGKRRRESGTGRDRRADGG